MISYLGLPKPVLGHAWNKKRGLRAENEQAVFVTALHINDVVLPNYHRKLSLNL
jgi:hypothetical protein